MIRNRTRYSCAVLALGILTLVTTVVGVVLHYSPVPYWDQWDGTIDFYMGAPSDPLRAFFMQHNEHRLFLSRIIFFADVRYFGGRNVFAITANIVLAALIALVIYRVAARHLRTSVSARIIAAGAALVFAFSWMQHENFTWGFQSQWFFVYLLALCAFHSLEVSSEFSAAGNVMRSRTWLVASIGSAALAALSMASGVLVSPVLVVQAFYLRFSRARIAFIGACTVAIWVAYFTNWHSPGGSGSLTVALREHPTALVAFVLLYLGAPAYYTGLGKGLTYAFGALVLLGLGYAGRIAVRPGPRPMAVSLLAMALFLAGNAAITAGGRLSFGLQTALSSRYATAALLSTCSVLFFLCLNESNPGRRKWTVGIFMSVVVLTASCQRTVFHSMHVELYRKMVAGLALRSHVYDPAYTDAIYPDPVRLRGIASRAEASGLSIFAPDQPVYDVAPPSVHASEQCPGDIDDIMSTMTPGMFSARGWAFDPATRKFIQQVVLADTNGTVVGTALTGDEHPELRDITHSKDRFGGWIGFFRKPETEDIRAFGKLGPGRYCSLREGKRLPDVAVTQTALSANDVPTQLIVTSARGFALGGAHFELGTAGQVSGSIYGSYVGGDVSTGELDLAPHEANIHTDIVMHYITGPSAIGQILRLKFAGEPTQEFSLPGTHGRWETLTIRPDSSTKVLQSLTLIDRGQGWGQWCAVALP